MGNNKRVNLNKKSSSLKKFSFIFLSLVSLSLLFSSYLFFTIKSIECKQNNQDCSKDTINKLSHLNGKSLLFTDLDKTLSQFSDYKISKKLPSTLILELSETQSSYYQISEENIITTTDQESLDKQLNEEINILFLELKKYEINYSQIKLNNNIFTIFMADNFRALISQDDVINGTYKLNQILKNIQLKEIDTAIKEIDTRFKMPVLKTKHSVI